MPVRFFAHDILQCAKGKCPCSLLLLIYYIVSGENARAFFLLMIYFNVPRENARAVFGF